jgi:hypothetical protein
MAGYEFSARKGEDTRQKVVARFGPPLAQETAGTTGQYHILSYPISGESEKLLLLFHGDELLGVFRESSRASLDNTVRSHQRRRATESPAQAHFEGGRPFISPLSGNNSPSVPKWKPGQAAPPPLSETQAETIATEWRKHLPGLRESKVRQVRRS